MTSPTVNLSPLPKQRFTDSNGNPLSGGKVFTYAAGTNTKQNSYTDSSGSTPNTNPVILDSRGEAAVWLDQLLAYKVTLAPVTDTDPPTNPIWTIDGIPAANAIFVAFETSLALSSGASLVGTIATGTDAVLRTQQAKNRDLVHMRDYGAACDGVTDDIVALQAAHDAIAAAGGGTLYVSQAKLNSTFNWDANKVAIQGDGGYWDFSGMSTAAAYAVNVVQSEPDINLRCAKNRAHPFRGVRLLGPIGVTTINGINIADPNGTTKTICGVTFENGSCSGFVADVSLGQGAFFTTFRDWDFTSDTAGHISQRNVLNPANSNSGERNAFDNCRFGLVTVENFNQTNGNATTICLNCSFNYAPRMGTISGGTLVITGGSHIEFSSDLDRMFYLSTAGNPSVTITSTTFAIAAAKSLMGFAYVDALVNTTGLTIRDCFLGSTNPLTVPWADGSGRVSVSNVGRYTAGGYMFLPSIGQNMLAYGDFESANFTVECNCQGSTIPARSTTIAKQGTTSLQFQFITGQTNFADITVPCTVGQTINASLWYQTTGLTGTGGLLQFNMRYVDAGNNLISTAAMIPPVSTTSGAWVLASESSSFPPAPPGTKSAQLRIIASASTSGTALGYVDVVNMVAQ